MNFRLIFLTTGLLTASALAGACSRDELAPWGFPKGIELDCTNLPSGVVGRPYTLDLKELVEGGVEPFMFAVTDLPPGLTLSGDGVISGTPTADGDFDIVITVTDGAGSSRTFDTCGNIVIEKADEAVCKDDTDSIPDGFLGIPYSWPVSFPGGAGPYTWAATGLPPGLELTFDPSDSENALISGSPTANGDYDIELIVTDAQGNSTTTQCGQLQVRDPVAVDHGALFADVGGCVPVGDGDYDTLDDLLGQGILGVDGNSLVPITCELKTGRGNGSGDFDQDEMSPDTMPPGITFSAGDCQVGGSVNSTLAYGIYGFIATYTQATSASTVNAYVPYCAPNMTQAPQAYLVRREDTGVESTFVPGVQQLSMGEAVAFGSDTPDPQVTVDSMGCGGNQCYYVFVFSYNTLSKDGKVSASPSASFPNPGFEGFTHAVQIDETDPALLEDRFGGRAWIVNVTFDYCVTNDENGCGRNEANAEVKRDIVRQEGNGSNYYFSLVLVPAP
jgi:hypothetical protein